MSTLTYESKTTGRSVAALTAALLTACIAFQLNASMLSPALVTMGNELHTDQAVIGLSQTWFFTAAALFSLFLPRLSDIVGRKKILLGMMLMMAVGSVIAAMAPDITWLFVGRIIQGVSGPTVPLCLIMLRSAVMTRGSTVPSWASSPPSTAGLPASTPLSAVTSPSITDSAASSGSWWCWPSWRRPGRRSGR